MNTTDHADELCERLQAGQITQQEFRQSWARIRERKIARWRREPGEAQGRAGEKGPQAG